MLSTLSPTPESAGAARRALAVGVCSCPDNYATARLPVSYAIRRTDTIYAFTMNRSRCSRPIPASRCADPGESDGPESAPPGRPPRPLASDSPWRGIGGHAALKWALTLAWNTHRRAFSTPVSPSVGVHQIGSTPSLGWRLPWELAPLSFAAALSSALQRVQEAAPHSSAHRPRERRSRPSVDT
jgi:hypothetical protein